MHVANPWKSYRQVSTLTAPPGQIVLLLYDGALRFLECALRGFSLEDPAEANMTIQNNLFRARDIIRELNHVLNMERGGDCAANLRRLYDYFERCIWDSNLRKQRDGVDEVIRHLTVLRDAWAAMLSQQSAGGSAPEPAPAPATP